MNLHFAMNIWYFSWGSKS